MEMSMATKFDDSKANPVEHQKFLRFHATDYLNLMNNVEQMNKSLYVLFAILCEFVGDDDYKDLVEQWMEILYATSEGFFYRGVYERLSNFEFQKFVVMHYSRKENKDQRIKLEKKHKSVIMKLLTDLMTLSKDLFLDEECFDDFAELVVEYLWRLNFAIPEQRFKAGELKYDEFRKMWTCELEYDEFRKMWTCELEYEE